MDVPRLEPQHPDFADPKAHRLLAAADDDVREVSGYSQKRATGWLATARRWGLDELPPDALLATHVRAIERHRIWRIANLFLVFGPAVIVLYGRLAMGWLVVPIVLGTVGVLVRIRLYWLRTAAAAVRARRSGPDFVAQWKSRRP